MKRLFFKILLFLPVLLLVVLINLIVDPAKIYSKGEYEFGIANYLLQNQNVENLANYDERLLQTYLIEGFEPARDMVVLGSSRSMQVNKEMFPGSSFINNSVSGATFEDILGLYELYRERDLLPATIILCLDPWTLNKNHGQVRWKTLSAHYSSAVKRLGLSTMITEVLLQDDIIPYRYFELFSPSYFQQSVKMLFKDKRKAYKPTLLEEGENNIKLADGSLSYNYAYREAPLDEINKKAVQEAFETPVYSLGDFNRLDPAYMLMLEALVDDYMAQGGELLFFLPPYHPKFYAAVVANDRYVMIDRAEDYYRQLASRHGIKVIGSYDPKKLSLAEGDFYDGMHLKRAATNRLFATAHPGP